MVSAGIPSTAQDAQMSEGD